MKTEDFHHILSQINAEGHSTPLPVKEVKNVEDLLELLSTITDPEIPVINIRELGILRSVELVNEIYQINISPTYSGCPAMGLIEMNIKAVLDTNHISNYKINTILYPPWTTDWITDETKLKLKQFGIAPPQIKKRIQSLFEKESVHCPRCQSKHTEIISEFSSTACKAMYRCLDCKEPFEYFKCHS